MKNDLGKANPEMTLERLNHRLLNLRSAVGYMKNESLFGQLTEVIRKTMIASVVYKYDLTAIAGLQGTGKTTLLRELYDLDPEDILPDNWGRGEMSPMLLLETNTSKLIYKIRKLVFEGGECDESEIEVTKEDFYSALKNRVDNQLLPIIYVPHRYFQGSQKGFLLLPGYEPYDGKNNTWQDLMRLALWGCTSSVITTDLAGLPGDKGDLSSDMAKACFLGAKPLIAITNTENWEKGSTLFTGAKNSAVKAFNIPVDHADERIVYTGQSKPYRSVWVDSFMKKLHKLSKITGAVRERQMENLGELLRKDIVHVLNLIEHEKTKDLAASVDSGKAVKEFLDVFDESVKDLRHEYSDLLTEALNKHANEAASTGVDKYIDEYEGVEGALNKVGDFIFYTSGEVERSHQNSILKAWNGKDGHGFRTSFQDLLGTITSRRLNFSNKPVKVTSASTIEDVLGYKGKNGKALEPRAIDANHEQNLKAIFLYKSSEQSLKELQLNKEAEQTIKLIPSISLEFLRVAAVFPDIVGVDLNTLLRREDDLRESVSRIKDEYQFLESIKSSIVSHIATIFMLDATDGQIDSIPLLLRTISGESTITSGTEGDIQAPALTGVNLVALCVAVGMISFSIIREVRREDAEKRDMIRRVIYAIRDANKEHYLKSFDSIMRLLRSSLKDKIAYRYKLPEHFSRTDRLNMAIAEVNSARTDMLESIGEIAPSMV